MNSTSLERTSVLGPMTDGIATTTAELRIDQAKPATRFSLRMDPAAAAKLSTAAGFALDQPINRLVGDTKLSMRLGPDEWMLVAEEQNATALAAELERSLDNSRHSVVDVSQRNIALILSGPRATDVLTTGCPLDFHPSAFPLGTATRTVIAKSEVVIAQTADMPVYRIECWRSFGRYLDAYLRNSARLQGIGGEVV